MNLVRRSFWVPLLIAACSGDGDAVPDDPEEPPIEPARIDSPRTFASELRCAPLSSDERVLDVSTAGDIWIAGEELRSIDAAGNERIIDAETTGELRALVAHSDRDGIALTSDGFWRIDEEGALFVFVPERVRSGVDFCGDPESDGQVAVIAPDGLFERDAGEWFTVSSADTGALDDIDWIGRLAGACHGRRGGIWVRHDEALLRVEGTEIRTYASPAGLAPVLDETLLATTEGNVVLVASERGPARDRWNEVEFVAGDVRAISASAGNLWVSVSDRLYRFDGEDWLEADEAVAASAIFAHNGGAWLVGESELCHVGRGSVRVRGLRSFELFFTPTRDLRVESIQGSGALTIAVDGGDALAGTDDGNGAVFNDVMLGAAGWHRLSVQRDGETLREIPYRVVAGDVSFARDVAPIAEAHCATAACHGATDEAESIPLTTFDEWRSSALDINDRVGRGTMPREPGATWSPTLATTIVDWVQGGRQP